MKKKEIYQEVYEKSMSEKNISFLGKKRNIHKSICKPNHIFFYRKLYCLPELYGQKKIEIYIHNESGLYMYVNQ